MYREGKNTNDYMWVWQICLISIPKSCIFKILNPTIGNDIVVAFTMNNSKGASLYDLIEIDEEMVLLIVKEHLVITR